MRRAGALLLLALSTLPESARPADMKDLPEAPSGYVLLQHHSVGNSANCGGAGGPGHGCHNMDPPDQLKNAGCGPGAPVLTTAGVRPVLLLPRSQMHCI